LRSLVKGIENGEIASTVKIEIALPATLTATIIKEAVDDLDLNVGD
jgi:molybdopterin-binding protein